MMSQRKKSGRHHVFSFLLRTGLFAAGVAAWAMTPRLAVTRRRDGVSAVPDVWYAHRGLHDAGSGLTSGYAESSGDYIALARDMARKAGYGTDIPKDSDAPVAPENSLPAFAAACEAGFGIELDLQLTADGKVVVAHDATLSRVAGDSRRIADLTYEELTHIPLFAFPCKAGDARVSREVGAAVATTDASGDPAMCKKNGVGTRRQGNVHVPLFADVLKLVAGRVPLIVEYKINHQGWEARDRKLMERGDALLRDYEKQYGGRYVVESFNPMAMRWYRNAHPEVSRGQLAGAASFRGVFSNGVGKASIDSARAWLSGLLAFNWLSRPDFIAYNWHGGDSLPVRLTRRMGATAVSWTVRSADERDRCEACFDRHIFEAFVPAEHDLQ